MDFLDASRGDVIDPIEAQWNHGVADGTFRWHAAFSLPSTVPVTEVYFDEYEELLWSGNQNGRLTSFYSSNMERYTAFAAMDGEIRAISTTEDMVLSISEKELRGNTRQGLPVFNFTSKNFINMTSMHHPLSAAHTLILGGFSDRLVQFDLVTQREQRMIMLRDQKCSIIIRENQHNVFTGDDKGTVTSRQPGSFEPIHTFEAHGASLIDMDVRGNMLITCGWSFRGTQLHGDPYVKIYDIRMNRALPPIPWTTAPAFCRFHSVYSDNRILVVSELGQGQVLDVNGSNHEELFMATNDAQQALSFHISPSTQAIAVGDNTGTVHLSVDRQNATFHENPQMSVFAAAQTGPPLSFLITDETTPLAAVPFPFSADNWLLSDWPEELCIPSYRIPRPPLKAQNARRQQHVSYVPNPRKGTGRKNYNIIPYILDAEEANKVVYEERPVIVPSFYKKNLNIKPNKFDDGYLRKFNSTTLTPLKSDSGSGYANPIILMLYWLRAVRNVFLGHVCCDDPCLCCELGFLFRLLADQKGATPASSNNFMRSLHVASANAQFLMSGSDVIHRIHELFAFLVRYIDNQLAVAERSRIRDLMATRLSMHTFCLRCQSHQDVEHTVLAVPLQYGPGSERLGLCGLIEKALVGSTHCDRECLSCGTTTRMQCSTKIKTLPPVILVDTNLNAEGSMAVWANQVRDNERRPVFTKPEMECFDASRDDKACRYGRNCRNRLSCKYSHGDDWKTEVDAWLTSSKSYYAWSHVLPNTLHCKVNNGIAIFSDNVPDDKTRTEGKVGESAYTYRLVSAVCGIASENGGWEHAVTAVYDPVEEQPPSEEAALNWSLLNDLMVTKVPEHEAIHIDHRWKMPLLIAYVREDEISDDTRARITDSVFRIDANLTGNDEIARMRRARTMPKSGDIVGLDAEFIDIDIKKDIGQKSVVARLSCIDQENQIIIDDYIATCQGDVVTNYLTRFSGIEEDDLNPTKSTKHLTTLKTVYLKILHLVQLGVIFVGHGLWNDFSTLNIYVPTEQIVDTALLYKKPDDRMLGLQFLAWHLLGKKIQEHTHDSVEDAVVAMQLYAKYKELERDGTVEQTIDELYDKGRACNFRVDGSVSPHKRKSGSPQQQATSDTASASGSTLSV